MLTILNKKRRKENQLREISITSQFIVYIICNHRHHYNRNNQKYYFFKAIQYEAINI